LEQAIFFCPGDPGPEGCRYICLKVVRIVSDGTAERWEALLLPGLRISCGARAITRRVGPDGKQGGAMAKRKDITGRDGYILVEALSFTIEAFSGLPIEFRPDNNITDMKRILDELIKQDTNLAQSQLLARRKLDQVLTHIRST
jgi:hypothetical protein